MREKKRYNNKKIRSRKQYLRSSELGPGAKAVYAGTNTVKHFVITKGT